MQLRLMGVLKEELVASAYTVLTNVVCGDNMPRPGVPVVVTVPAPRADACAPQPAPRKRRRTAAAAPPDSSP